MIDAAPSTEIVITAERAPEEAADTPASLCPFGLAATLAPTCLMSNRGGAEKSNCNRVPPRCNRMLAAIGMAANPLRGNLEVLV